MPVLTARPLINVHDVVVAGSHRGRGIAARLFAEVEAIARERGACSSRSKCWTAMRRPARCTGGSALPPTGSTPAWAKRSSCRNGWTERRHIVALALAWAAWLPHPAWSDAPPPAPAMLLAEVYDADVDVTQYWGSEKFDGVRAQWDGRSLRFRGGGTCPGAGMVHRTFPAAPLDGELWIGRGQFDALSGTVRKTRTGGCRMAAGALPGFRAARRGGRLQRTPPADAGNVVAAASVPWLQVVEQTRVADHVELMRQLDAVVRTGGEGLMLHRADAPYLTGRSDALLKLKPWQDAEAVVVGHAPGKGKYQGMTGALEMEMPDGNGASASAAAFPMPSVASRPPSAHASRIAINI